MIEIIGSDSSEIESSSEPDKHYEKTIPIKR